MISRDAKYIVFDDGLNEYPVIFPNYVQHGNMALTHPHRPVSAGFVSADMRTYGRSQSLGLDSRSTDTVLIRKMFKGDKQ